MIKSRGYVDMDRKKLFQASAKSMKKKPAE